MAALLELGQRQTLVQGAVGINQFVEEAIDQKLPTQQGLRTERAGVLVDAGRAVARKGVIPLGSLVERVYFFQVMYKYVPDQLGLALQAIEINIFVPEIRAQLHEIPFIGYDVG